MPLDAQTERLLAVMSQNAPAPGPLDPVAMRQFERAMLPPLARGRALVGGVEDRDIPGPGGTLPLRIYRPKDGGCGGTLVYLHGGGFVLGSLDTHDAVCCALAAFSGCVVASVGYRLAPEHKHPAAILDAFAATEWVSAHAAELGGDPARLAVGGDSAGGNLAANVALMARDRGAPPVAFQLLIYPTTHGRTRTPSQDEFAEGYFLTRDLMSWFSAQYMDGATRFPYGAPFDAEDLRGLPPALVITAEYDPLRDQGAQYADRLREAGVPVEYTCYDGTIHGFVSFAAAIDKGRVALAQCGTALRTALGRAPASR